MNEHFCRLVGEHLIQQEVREERVTLAQRLIALLGVICLLVLVTIATDAHAAPLFRAEAEGVTMTRTANYQQYRT